MTLSPAAFPKHRSWKRGALAAGYIATVVVVVALWGVVTDAGWVSDQTLPKLQDIARALGTLSDEGLLWSNALRTLFRILLSFMVGLVLGIPFGGLLWRFPAVGAAVRPYLAASYAVPTVVFYPFFLVVLGLNDWPVVVLAAALTMIPICLNTMVGLQSVPRVLVNVGRGLERTPAQIFRQVMLPAAWPDILAGLRLSMVYGVAGIVSLEFVAAQSGVGNRIQYYYELFDVDSMYAFIVLTLGLAGICVGLVFLLDLFTMRGRR